MLNKAVINLNNLRDNVLEIKKRLPVATKFCAVVKADAYGHGACECANAIYDLVDCYAVALVEEGVELRYGSIDKDILVLVSPFDGDILRALEFNLTLSVCSLSQIRKINFYAQKLGKKAKVHIKINTGMNRQGVSSISNLKEILEFSANENNNVYIDGVYSHFACPENQRARNLALDKFLLAISTVKGYNNKVVSHISASGGFLKGVYLDMVRIGIALYGYKPFNERGLRLKKVMRVYAPVTTVRRLKRGDGCNYGTFKLEKDQEVALVRYGYADGMPRRKIKGQINFRCMDLTAINAQGLGVFRGKFICVMDDAERIAKEYGTISYEILTKCAIRAQKIYIK